MKILVDAGHGGTDPGAVNNNLNLKEAVVTLVYSKKLAKILSDAGNTVVLTRIDDNFVSLQDRVMMANASGVDLFLSLHCNSAENESAAGVEIWTSPGETKSDGIATQILEAIQQAFPDQKFRKDTCDGDPDKEANFFVLKYTKMPAVLLELGFISNAEDAVWLQDFGTMMKYCQSIAAGVAAVNA